MTVLDHEPALSPPSLHGPRRRRRLALVAVVATALVAALVAAVGYVVLRYEHDDSRRQYLAGGGWPGRGEAAYQVGPGALRVSPRQPVVPIASVAKVMTAVVVLRHDPLPANGSGFRMTVTAADVADLARRHSRDESVVAVRAGEVLTERDALAALLLPSANNVAVLLARRVSGSVPRFVAAMNAEARTLHLTHTRYTDPSGFDASTVSTAADQVRLADAAMRTPALADLVARRSYVLPVAGTVHNTDFLLGQDGFVGIKTGSMDSAGGCFVFRVVRTVHGRPVVLTGAVLGQPGHNLIRAGQYAARQLADRVYAALPTAAGDRP